MISKKSTLFLGLLLRKCGESSKRPKAGAKVGTNLPLRSNALFRSDYHLIWHIVGYRRTGEGIGSMRALLTMSDNHASAPTRREEAMKGLPVHPWRRLSRSYSKPSRSSPTMQRLTPRWPSVNILRNAMP